MLAVGLHGSCNQQQLVGVAAQRDRIGKDVPRRGQRAGLVEQDRIDLPHSLECEPVLHEDSIAGRKSRRDRDDERNRESQRVRTCDDQDRNRPFDGRALLPDKRPHRVCDGDEGFGVGDYFVIGSDPLYNRAGTKQVGHTNGDCLLTELDEATFEVTFECDVTFVLRNGSITAEGPFSGTETGGSGNLAVTGGTGRYRTAHGEVHVTETDTGLTAEFGLLL
jgi:hypothetical protein